MEMPENDTRRVIGVRAAAELARVSEQTIRRGKEAGIIEGRRNPHNGHREIFEDSVIAFRRRD
jgi:DNA-binding transcriptional MerR regulator